MMNKWTLASLVMIAAVVLWGWASAWTEHQCETNHYQRKTNPPILTACVCDAQSTKQTNNTQGSAPEWDWPEMNVQWATFWAIVCTLLAVVWQAKATADSAAAAQKSADTAERALVSTQRAFVFVDLFHYRLVNQEIWFQAKWKNSGATPALRRRTYASWKSFPDVPPADWTWPNLGKFGFPTEEPEIAEGFLGPQATSFSVPLKVNIAELERARTGFARIFLYGWSEYDDAIGGKIRHRTEFCNEVDVTEMTRTPDGVVTVAATFPQYGTYNTAT